MCLIGVEVFGRYLVWIHGSLEDFVVSGVQYRSRSLVSVWYVSMDVLDVFGC